MQSTERERMFDSTSDNLIGDIDTRNALHITNLIDLFPICRLGFISQWGALAGRYAALCPPGWPWAHHRMPFHSPTHGKRMQFIPDIFARRVTHCLDPREMHQFECGFMTNWTISEKCFVIVAGKTKSFFHRLPLTWWKSNLIGSKETLNLLVSEWSATPFMAFAAIKFRHLFNSNHTQFCNVMQSAIYDKRLKLHGFIIKLETSQQINTPLTAHTYYMAN